MSISTRGGISSTSPTSVHYLFGKKDAKYQLELATSIRADHKGKKAGTVPSEKVQNNAFEYFDYTAFSYGQKTHPDKDKKISGDPITTSYLSRKRSRLTGR